MHKADALAPLHIEIDARPARSDMAWNETCPWRVVLAQSRSREKSWM